MTKFSAQQQSQLAQIGVFLREKREQQGKSLEDIAIRTYIRPQLLSGIESGDPDLLPEPIFVQGFIRRYAENLGLKGTELAQQFSVDSIPSTPRPARQSMVEDSPTTRLTRTSTAGSATSDAISGSHAVESTAEGSATMFSAGSASPLEDSLIAQRERDAASGDIESARRSSSEVPLIVDDAVLEMQAAQTAETPAANAFEASDTDLEATSDEMDAEAAGFSFSQTDISSVETSAFETPAFETASEPTSDFQSLIDRATASDGESPDLSLDSNTLTGSTASSTESTNLATSGFSATDVPSSEDTFADKVAEFDRQNMQPATDSSTSTPASNSSFDDDLPAAFTTASATTASATTASATSPTSASSAYTDSAYTDSAYGNETPIGVAYDQEGPNLKPFVIGGIVAALLTAAVVALASLFGGDRAPSVAENPDTIEQAGSELETVDSETLPPVPEEPNEPPASTAPIYVEATATAEAWVSVIADENGVPLFEGTLQPGDTAVWEGQETISVYSGDAGALELSRNGEPATVMGERGQPEEEIFTLN